MVCWVEPSAQNSIYISNNPSHKKASRAEFLSALVCVEPPRSNVEAPGSVRPDHFVGDVGDIYTIPLRPPTVIFSIPSFLTNRSSLSPKFGAPNSLAQIFVIL